MSCEPFRSATAPADLSKKPLLCAMRQTDIPLVSRLQGLFQVQDVLRKCGEQERHKMIRSVFAGDEITGEMEKNGCGCTHVEGRNLPAK